ncbi:MAG: hypothetical protein HN705_10550 [Rhodospirillales bacterium]|jgi:hypothetical protein|nr:hypothetical protein [Rhodospirillales bacterium]
MVDIGERFRSASRSAFGYAGGAVFEVDGIRVDGCVVPHALLFNVSNPSDRRLISVDALNDTNLFFPVEFQSIAFTEPAPEQTEL